VHPGQVVPGSRQDVESHRQTGTGMLSMTNTSPACSTSYAVTMEVSSMRLARLVALFGDNRARDRRMDDLDEQSRSHVCQISDQTRDDK
jgi:hypothetical protein